MSQSTEQGDDYEEVFVTESGWATVSSEGPDEDGPAGVREPLTPQDDPPPLAAEAELPDQR